MACRGPALRAAVAAILGAALLLPRASASGVLTEMFTTNAACRQKHCINPIFPGLLDLGKLEQAQWVCSTHASVKAYLNFCRGPVIYDPALPSPASATGAPITALVRNQEEAAMTAYFYHLSGMGLEPWDFQDPHSTKNDCVKSVHRMACFTYFPRTQAGCAEGGATQYLRPCKSSCHNYKKQCEVECCDGSDTCVFQHEIPASTRASSVGNTSMTQTGYVNELGPSAFCTGGAGSKAPHRMLFAVLLLQALVGGWGFPSLPRAPRLSTSKAAAAALLVVLAVFLQGCDYSIPVHKVAEWRKAMNYLISFEYIPAGQPPTSAVINSCNPKHLLDVTEQCAGNGFCTPWNSQPGDTTATDVSQKPFMFCHCNPEYTDPECRTRRKSQTVAFLWSLFFGFLGADQFYLGFPVAGILKLVTLGGAGAWWIFDTIRIGSAPVYAVNYKVAADLPFWTYVFSVFSFMTFVGFVGALVSAARYRTAKRKEAMLQKAEEEAQVWRATAAVTGTEPRGTYGAAEQRMPHGH